MCQAIRLQCPSALPSLDESAAGELSSAAGGCEQQVTQSKFSGNPHEALRFYHFTYILPTALSSKMPGG